jgi:hypothetical protein
MMGWVKTDQTHPVVQSQFFAGNLHHKMQAPAILFYM